MGGILWIGPIFFTFIILYASLLSFPREAFIIVLITFICYSSVIFLQYLGLIPYKEFFKLTPYLYKDSQYVTITILVGGFIFFIFFLTGKNFSQRLKQKNTELAQAKKGLEEWNIKLEEKVRLRTLELIKLNEDLKQDMTKRKKAEERLKKTMNATIETMSKMIEAKDPYTSGHQHRVCQLAVPLARELGLPEDKIEGIRIASLIHDIGKIGLPAEILSNPTKLTEIEFNLIKNHSQMGHDIFKSIDFSYPIARIVLQHHEKMNGSGYPRGLKGDEILLEAKIICVADVVEAMSSHRPYRPALGIDAALEEISKNKGILYDPEVVDVCLELFKEKGFKFK
ncbi:HD-GYP domain-containing protein [Candidatus Atribacteria bacterium 1244-E10-H5-B2]|nr:MAG: HD-GYP domain-containing protein [Candidatus Atribacteria bacterium 1244-E10-H5-B2]